MHEKDTTSLRDSQRRRLIGTGGVAALALSSTAVSAAAVQPEARARLTRARYSISADFVTGVATLPVTLPLDVTNFRESEDFSLQGNGKVLINTPGLYRFVLACDWVGQNGTDIDVRLIGIRRKKVGSTAPDNQDDKLASVDTPGSNPPQMVRYQGAWTPGFIAMGATLTTVIDVPTGIVVAGDLALAAHTSISDDVLTEAAVNGLIVHAKVVAPNKVRVALFNATVAEGVDVPRGTLNVVAMSSILTRGESADAWQWLHTATEEVAAGDQVYAVVRSRVRGDYLQATRSTFLQLEKIG